MTKKIASFENSFVYDLFPVESKGCDYATVKYAFDFFDHYNMVSPGDEMELFLKRHPKYPALTEIPKMTLGELVANKRKMVRVMRGLIPFYSENIIYGLDNKLMGVYLEEDHFDYNPKDYDVIETIVCYLQERPYKPHPTVLMSDFLEDEGVDVDKLSERSVRLGLWCEEFGDIEIESNCGCPHSDPDCECICLCD